MKAKRSNQSVSTNSSHPEYVFRRAAGRPLSQTRLDQQHSDLKALLKLSQEFVLHSLRYSFGTRLGESGADACTIMRLMGHSGVTASQRYMHPSPELIERLEALNERKGSERVKWQQLGTESDTVTDPAPAAVQ